MRRSIGSARIRWARYLLAPLAPAALCFIGCDAETNPDESSFPNLETEWSAGGSTPPSEIGCVKVVVKERSLSAPLTPEKNVSGMRLLPTSSGYNHVGGAVYSNANGEATLYVKVNNEVTFLYNHPANYKLAVEQQPVITTCTKAQADIGACACAPTILFVTLCGNGALQGAQVTPPGTEQCDDGNSVDYDACTNHCTLPACGDGILQPNAPMPEQCDDGNTASGDGCDANCKPTGCGNGVQTGMEGCDDGNTTNGDGCDNNCTMTGCGNGIKTNNEGCDDGNSINGDGCNTLCLIESTFSCANNSSCASSICLMSGVCGCNANSPCPGALVCGTGQYANTCITTGCGNAIVNVGEGCDDGNINNGDGCSSSCMIELNWPCTVSATCASGFCDPANSKCACDASNDCPANHSCNTAVNPNQCVPFACGNGIPEGAEVCDDGNTMNGDGCDNNCTMTGCGNAIVTSGEQCDDGNSSNIDACTNVCNLAACGDGFVQLGETCEDGNTNNLDACNNSCGVSGGTIATYGYNGAANSAD